MAEKMKVSLKRWLTVLLMLTLAAGWGNYYINPTRQSAAVGQTIDLSSGCPPSLLDYVTVNNGEIQKQITESWQTGNAPGELNLSLKLFGLIPLKQVSVSVVEEKYLYPGGQSIGILLRTQGVLVVGVSPIVDESGQKSDPAEEAGIEVGDVIVKVNEQQISDDEKLSVLINELGASGEEIVLTIERDQTERKVTVKPIFCAETKKWRIGLFVRDNAGGIGTLTFIDPESGSYGALGHMVADNNTGDMLNIPIGKLVHASIEGVRKGERGDPGEKLGSFVSDQAIGDIAKNTECGIFGKIDSEQLSKEKMLTEPLPVALASEIEYAPAEIYTVLEGNKVEVFEVEIVKIMPKGKTGKELVLKVTDERLIKRTGGIVQGMSGSPIIQNGKIVGAVTYVFVNDPTKGYGILIEDMLEEMGK